MKEGYPMQMPSLDCLNESNQAMANILIKALRREIERKNCPSPKVKYIMVIIYDKEGV